MNRPALTWIALFAIALASCTGGVKEDSQGTAPVDTIRQETDTAKLVTGVAVGGAMNSVSLKVGDDTNRMPYYVAMGVSGAALLALAIVGTRRRKGKEGTNE